MPRWVALFSQTGSEIVEIAEHLGVWPSRILTNNSDLDKINPKLHGRITVMSHNGIEETLEYMDEFYGTTIVTLHGYLRILSPGVCKTGLQIYNGHPAYISQYPELKGKDPQEKTWENIEKYPLIGSTIHKVVSEVDSGELEREWIVENTCTSKEEVYNTLRKTSLEAWLYFLKGKL